MCEYEVVFQAIIDSFEHDMFGPFANSISRSQFQYKLATDGWKYFNRRNLNEFFSIKHDEAVKKGVMNKQADFLLSAIRSSLY